MRRRPKPRLTLLAPCGDHCWNGPGVHRFNGFQPLMTALHSGNQTKCPTWKENFKLPFGRVWKSAARTEWKAGKGVMEDVALHTLDNIRLRSILHLKKVFAVLNNVCNYLLNE